MGAVNNPEDADAGMHPCPWPRTWIDQEDFRERLPKGTNRLYPGMKSGCGMAISSSVRFRGDPLRADHGIHCT